MNQNTNKSKDEQTQRKGRRYQTYHNGTYLRSSTNKTTAEKFKRKSIIRDLSNLLKHPMLSGIIRINVAHVSNISATPNIQDHILARKVIVQFKCSIIKTSQMPVLSSVITRDGHVWVFVTIINNIERVFIFEKASLEPVDIVTQINKAPILTRIVADLRHCETVVAAIVDDIQCQVWTRIGICQTVVVGSIDIKRIYFDIWSYIDILIDVVFATVIRVNRII